MAVTLLMVGISLALFVYWFRYTATLILRTRSSPEHVDRVTAANRLRFAEVRQQLHSRAAQGELRGMRAVLEQDYRVLTYLLGHAANISAGSYTAEQRLLMANFYCMGLWCSTASRLFPNSAKMALLEMSSILEYFASVIGQRLGALSRVSARA